MYSALSQVIGSIKILTSEYTLRRTARMVKGSKTKVRWALINAWQSDSTFLVRLPLLSGQELRNHSLLPVFVNKVLLELSHNHLLHMVSLLFLCCMEELSICNRDLMAHKA